MNRHSRQAIGWVLVVVLLVSGCATAPRYQVADTIPEADQSACKERAQKEADAAERGSFTGGILRKSPLMVLSPEFWAFLPFTALIEVVEVAREPQDRAKIFDSELRACVEVKDAEMRLGPEDPLLAHKLLDLATRYAQGRYARWNQSKNNSPTLARSDYGSGPLMPEAEALYARALAIQEKALGPEHADVAVTLWAYARLLRATGREPAAAELESRALEINAKNTQEPSRQAAAESAVARMDEWLK